eukprot:SAG11_NODE_146_length_14788_cov_5.672884_12_plen_82_part_00
MCHDNIHCEWMATQIAKRMYPHVICATPIAIGVSEHHMEIGPGTLTVRYCSPHEHFPVTRRGMQHCLSHIYTIDSWARACQ